MSLETGVYTIRNTVNGKVYVGSSARSFHSRWKRHRAALRKGIHHSRYLQFAWNKYGAGSFVWEVCEVTLPEHAVACEQVMIDYYKSADISFGYNVQPTAGSPLGMKHTDESKAKMSASHLRRIQSLTHSPELIAKLVAAMRASNIGRPLSQEHRRSISGKMTGRKQSPEHIEKRAAARRGTKQSAAHTAKSAAARRGKTRSAEARSKHSDTLLRKRLSKASARLIVLNAEHATFLATPAVHVKPDNL